MSKQRHEEREFFLGDRGGAVTVVEYLQSIMSKELLGKFPDNSAFDFDYTQSSIWSPLIQRQNGRGLDMEELSKSLSSSSSFSPSVLQRKLEYNEEEDCDEMAENEISSKCITSSVSIKKLTAVFKRKIGVNVFDSFRIYRDAKMKKKCNRKGLGFSPSGAVKSPNLRKGWAKMLKAGSGQFKRTSKKKDNGNASQLKFSHKYLGYLND
ncbi:hypothetical protein DCAR_0933965 [Daucus carota subsp. sativus]|uniref:Uncharacterized protein n=1 Tax=Daucus carota subsp. sativus TaxID=79200 RepID=A0A175YEH4_DAUCS|nr:PREDICTED: uncharacterized protein LOC108201998 [Daucus carota subsp. sativus]WOH14446.1 hypothetical protein DCAR_0933965 [Daucus carota subsp. sativus]